MATRKRSSGKGKGKTQRKGLSGNPQRRDAQVQEKASDARARLQRPYAPHPEMRRPGKQPPSWWAESHERVLAAARGSAWPSRLLDVESRACELAGDEFYDRMNSEGSGLDAARWLGALANLTRKNLQTAILNDTGDSLPLLSLLLGLTLVTPKIVPFAESKSAQGRLVEMLMPPADEPYDVKLDLAAKSLAEYASAAWSGNVPEQARRAGNAVFARDVYGSRFLVAAPFGYGDPDGSAGLDVVDVDHWYAWDIDMCGLDVAAGAGAFGSAEEALAEWREAVGPSASGAVLAPCPEEMLPVLLDSCLEGSLPGMDGSEPRELIREYHRKQQRARALAWHDEFAVGESYDVDPDIDAFQAWYGARHPSEVPPDLAETADSIIQNWGPLECPDALTFYACSPHRIQYVAVLLRDSFIAEHANEALRLLPEWTQWCLSRNGVGEDSEWGGRALEAARAEAAALAEAYSRSRLT